MRMPGFNAETSLYRTSVDYRLMGALIQADGVRFQRLHFPLEIVSCDQAWAWCLQYGWDPSGWCSWYVENCGNPPTEGPQGPQCPRGCVPDFRGQGGCICGGGDPVPM